MAIDAPSHSRYRPAMQVPRSGDVPFWRRSRGRRIARFIVILCCLYIGTFLVLLALEDRFLVPGASGARPWREPPTESGCYAAGEAALRWLEEVQRVPTAEVILVGESMGGAVATELATRHVVRLLVLHGAFTSFPDMAQVRVPFYPSRYLVRNRMDNEAKIGLVRCPVLITHGTADAIVPFHQGERLFSAAHEPKRFVRMEGHGHGPPATADFFEDVKTFLAETAR